MSEELVLKLGQETLKTTAMLSGPLLLSALVVGLVVSIFQAVTQINRAIEAIVLSQPGQYLWGYARYKTPRKEAPL